MREKCMEEKISMTSKIEIILNNQNNKLSRRPTSLCCKYGVASVVRYICMQRNNLKGGIFHAVMRDCIRILLNLH